MNKSPTYERFFWCDCETAGLDVNTDAILEIAIIITDFSLKELTRVHTFVSNATPSSKTVRKMHKDSGLTKALADIDNFPTLDTVDRHLNGMIDDLITGDSSLYAFYPAGSSVSFDVKFIQKNFPLLAARLHYRQLDVSSLILACNVRCHGKFKNKVKKIEPQHRAMPDIETSLAFMRRYYSPRWRAFR